MAEKYAIRVHAIAVADDNGSNAATITAALVASRLTTVTTIFAPAEVEFVFDAAADFTKINNTLLNREFTLLEEPNAGVNKWDHEPLHDVRTHHQARESLAQLYPGKLVLIYRNRLKVVEEKDQDGNPTGLWFLATKGGGASSSNAYFVDMSTTSNAKDLAHEIGHYLQLPHTFSEANTVVAAAQKIRQHVAEGHPKAEGLDALDGDRFVIRDTPADCSITIFKNLGLDECGSVDSISIPVKFDDSTTQTYSLAPDRSLVMSYFKHCSGKKTISPDQARRVRDALESRVRHDLIGDKASPAYKITRGGTGTAGAISAFDMALVRAGRMVTAVRDGSGDLKVIAWDIDSSGNTITRRGTAEAGKVSAIATCSLGMNLVATAMRDGGNELTVIVWRVEENGSVTRLGSAPVAGQITDVACCIVRYTMGSNAFVTAVRKADGTMKLDAWNVTVDGAIHHKASAEAGLISTPQPGMPIPRVALCNLGAQSVAAYVRDGSGNLKVILWQFDGEVLTRLDSAEWADAPVGSIAACSLARDRAVAVVQGADKALNVIAYRFPEDGGHVVQDGAAIATAPKSIHDTSVCRMGTEMAITGVRDAANQLALALWRVPPAANQIVPITSLATPEELSELAMCCTGRKQFTTALRDDQGRLKVIVWRLAGSFVGPAPDFDADTSPAVLVDSDKLEVEDGASAIPGECDCEE
jgi:hypothetical protein